MSDTILSVRNLSVRYRSKNETAYAVDDVSFDLERGKVLALVGESGSGKTTTGLALLKLFAPGAELLGGEVWFDGRSIFTMPDREVQSIRGRRMTMIFQDPVAGLNPVLSVGDQVAELLASHTNLSKRETKARVVEILRDVGLADPERVAKAYPFQLSGGMCQRVMIGMATALDPDVIVADEPTSALDVTVQAQIVYQLDQLRRERGTAILWITHNFGVVSQIADDVAVMYAGRLVETGPVMDVLSRPLHPYTHGLLSTLPRLDTSVREHLPAIPGNPPDNSEPAQHCPFIPRRVKALNACRNDPVPPLVTVESGRKLACYNPVWQG
ncbi:MAG: ABC transporter ATP-binding protein [Dehalococcoidia bacterium]